MDFLYMFDLLDFDNKGNLKAAKGADLAKAQSNFLYLISKYNQLFLKAKKLPVPDFFKGELGNILADVEAGGDYRFAKSKVFAACLPQVNVLSEKAEKQAVLALNNAVSLEDVEFAESFQDAKNTLQLEYIMTITAGKLFNKVEALKNLPMSKENKSKLFKEVIKYNALILATSKVRESGNAVQSEGFAG